jgi:hypothetical protein
VEKDRYDEAKRVVKLAGRKVRDELLNMPSPADLAGMVRPRTISKTTPVSMK